MKDDYLANRLLRDRFRQRKKDQAARKEKNERILGKTGLKLDLVDECPEDVKFAQLLSIQVYT